MNAGLEHVRPEMDEDDVLELILKELLARAEPELAETIRLCAIPHWFDEDILAWLRSDEASSKQIQEILLKLIGLTFVTFDPKRGWVYHSMVRDLLLNRWCQQDEACFKEISLRMADYYASDMENRYEYLYHLLAGDNVQGFALFDQEISQVNGLYQFSSANHLLKLSQEPCIKLSQEQQWHIRFYQGEMAANSGHWDEALPILDSLQKENLPKPLRGKVLARLGTVYNRRGQWVEAISYYQDSLELGDAVDPTIRAWTYTGLGLIYKSQRKWEKAIACNRNAIRIAEQTGDLLWQGRAFNNLGEISQLQGQLNKAGDYYQNSIQIKQQVGDQFGLVWTYINQGTLYIEQSKSNQALESLNRGLRLTRAIGSLAEEAWALENLGELDRREGNYESALEQYTQALAVCDRINEVYRKANIQAKLGRLYKDLREFDQALYYLEISLNTFEQLNSFEADRVREEVDGLRKQLKSKILP